MDLGYDGTDLRVANREAMNHYQEAWRLIDAVREDDGGTERRLDTAIKLAEVMEPLGEFAGRLSYGGEAVTLSDDRGNPADHVRYFDDAPWPDEADGWGASASA